jgi:hypothetical protein
MMEEKKKLFDWRLIRIPRMLLRLLLTLLLVVILATGLVVAVKFKGGEVPFLAKIGRVLGIVQPVNETPDDDEQEVVESRSARLIFVRGNVTVKPKQELHFQKAEKDRILYEGDSIRTYSGGHAEVAFDDGNRLTIKPDSFVVIRDMKQNRLTKIKKSSINLQQSDVEATIRPPKVAGSEFVIITPTAQATISEAKVAVQVSKDKESRLKVFKGSVDLQVGREQVEVTENKSVAVSSGKEVGDMKDLPPPPELLEPQNLAEFSFKTLNEMKAILQWKEIAKKMKYRIQVALDPFFTDFVIVRTGLSEAGVVIQGLKNGIYYWRVNAITPDGVEGDFTDKKPPDIKLDDIILLKVSGRLNAQISGQTETTASVTINGAKVIPDKTGRFRYMLSHIKPGEEVTIVARDPVGNRNILKKRIDVQ